MKKFPSSQEIINEAIKKDPEADLNNLHSITYSLMLRYRDNYYKSKVDDFIQRQSIKDFPNNIKELIKKELLKPIIIEDKEYSNFMEEASRRISQTFQPISGKLAELCVEKELMDINLQPKVHYRKRNRHTDLEIFYPQLENYTKIHRVEVKNVSLRERGTRGLKFDGDSIIGFFREPSEFTQENINIIDQHCEETGGYCYLPPDTLQIIKQKKHPRRFKSNENFAFDMKKFIKTGSI